MRPGIVCVQTEVGAALPGIRSCIEAAERTGDDHSPGRDLGRPGDEAVHA
jgi:hypothetical protein